MIRQKLLGPSGLRVSELCLGTLTFGEPKRWGADAESAAAILSAFVDAGGTFIDTAPNYASGVAEEIVGCFIRGRRDNLVIATKFTAAAEVHPLAGGNSRKSMMRAVEGSLTRLGTDHIDLLWLHYWDGTTPADEILRAFDDLVRAGKVLYVGLSDTPAWVVSRAATIAELRGLTPVIASQIEYNVAARTAERELLPMADALGLGVVCWGALAAGALAAGDQPLRRAPDSLPPTLAKVADAIAQLSAESGVAPISLALHWLMDRPGGRMIPLIGARTEVQIRNTIAAAAAEVDGALLAALDGIAPPRLGFPHELIASPYLRKLALGDPSLFVPEIRARS
jgi:aryl-alcohol dehydrogenase-like predicted oxidoreductase|tara:strand:- start:4897 stop:5913 length:1017 start_codon:yes stop_codon:yes gene_type:complete